MRSSLLLFGLFTASTAAAQTCPLDDNVLSTDVIECNQSYSPVSFQRTSADDYSGTCSGANYPGVTASFEFTPPAGQAAGVAISWIEKKADLDLFVLGDDNCGTGSTCIDAGTTAATPSGAFAATERVAWAADGNPVYINVEEASSRNGPLGMAYTLASYCSDGCDATGDVVQELYCSTDISSTTSGGTDKIDFYVCDETVGFPDVAQLNEESVYIFEPQADGPVTFRLTNLTNDQDLYVLEDSCDPTSCISASNRADADSEEVTFDAVVGTTYYIVVEAFAGPANFTLEFVDDTGGCNEDCDDNIDNDRDGLIDCADLDDCGTDPACACDNDGDGSYLQGGACGGNDCDDNDPLRYPGNVEVCDGIDNDCDNTVDEGVVPTWYTDADGDDYGVGAGVDQCEQPPDTADRAGDCDDAAASVNPGAPEACNGVDDDCNGQVDDGVTSRDWFEDLDGDGYGDGTPVNDCKPPATGTWVSVAGDCDDSDPAINPGEAEVCDGADQNCNGQVDEGIATTDYYRDVDQDGVGAGSKITSCQPPTFPTSTTSGDCDDGDASIKPGATEICDDIDQDCDGVADDGLPVRDWFADGDSDGYGTGTRTTDCKSPGPGFIDASGDCDDTKASINPGATEICDGIDQDCDGVADNGIATTPWFRDADSDGYGAGTAVNDCRAPAGGYVNQSGDCNDGAASINPAATEICDDIDQDCDGTADDGIPTTTYYRDVDGDGYGGNTSIDDCAQPGGWLTSTGDCDDGAPAVNPDAPEICDGLDNDCDGLVDTDDDDVDVTQLGTWYEDTDGDGFGNPDVSTQSCGAVAGHVANAGDCDDAAAAVNPDATEVCNDIDDDCDSDIDDADDSLDSSTGSTFYADVDGDGQGSAGNTVEACDPPTGTVTNTDDCDDGNADRKAGGTEVCDGVDNDCDFTVDEGTSCYDDDGDGATEDGGDCDDTTVSISPTATESCDTVDQDCDGIVDEETDCYDDDGDGESENDGDCNDGDRNVFSGNTEVEGNGIDDDCDGAVDSNVYDPDGDGYTTDGGDCGEGDATTYPGAPERPDGRDNDCDGDIDEGSLGADDDGDGFCEGVDLDSDGNPDCSDGSIPGDCNDANVNVYPEAEETVDGVDEDCDGQADNGTDQSDDDGDGYSESEGDCDDLNADIYPGADEANNGKDDDCDGLSDELWDDLDGDGVTAADGDCDDASGWISPERPEMCGDGIDNDCDGVAEEQCSEIIDPGTTNPPPPGCGCATGSTPSAPVPLFLLLALAARRRREVA